MRRSLIFAVLACFCIPLLLPTAPAAQATRPHATGSTLVKNINTETKAGTAYIGAGFPFAVAGNQAYFVSYDTNNGYELWATDGTTANTRLLRDLNPGRNDGKPTGMVDLNGKLFFAASSAAGAFLWKSDGTTAGTQTVIGTQPGQAFAGISEPFATTDAVFFQNGNSLWKSDGSAAGTTLLYTWTQLRGLGRFVISQGKVFFFVGLGYGTNDSTALWVSDGTPSGTELVKVVSTKPGAFPDKAVTLGTNIYFGMEGALWRSNGSQAGTQILTGNYQAELTSHADMLYYRGIFDVPQSGNETHVGLLRLAPNSTSPEVLYDFNYDMSYPASPSNLVSAGTRLFFRGSNFELWSSDGTSTKPVTTPQNTKLYILTDFGQEGSQASYQGSLYLPATQNVNATPTPRDLWAVNIATGLATRIHQTEPDEGSGTHAVTILGNTLLFLSGSTIWKSDGSSANSSRFYSHPSSGKGIYDNDAAYVEPEQVALNGLVVFTVANKLMRELWVSDGTELGTHKLFEENTYGRFGLKQWNGAVYFWSTAGANRGLWRTDGTNAGTVPVKSFDTATSFFNLVAVGQSLYFMAGVAGDMHLWKSDGSTAGTIVAVTLPSSTMFGENGIPGPIEAAGDLMFFTATDESTGRELWVSDGTQAGTHITKNIPSTFNSSSILGLTAVGDRVFFLEGILMSYGYRLWVSDGTESGTKLAKDLGPVLQGDGSTLEGQTIDLNGKAFFTGWDSSAWVEPWISDGTEAGTRRIKDINQQPSYQGPQLNDSSSPYNMGAVNGKALFSANDGIHGTELWISDGTEQGTTMLVDLNPGPIGSGPSAVTSFGSFAIFAASNGADGVEVWRTDGSAAGTTMLADVALGPGSSNPFGFTVADQKLFFIADDGETGPELHMLSLAQNEQPTASPTTTASPTATPSPTATGLPRPAETRYHVFLPSLIR